MALTYHQDEQGSTAYITEENRQIQLIERKELLQIKLTPSEWDRITWFLDGEIVPNPFE